MEYSEKTKDLGDRIVNLTLLQAKELSEYLEFEHGIKPTSGVKYVPPKQEEAPKVVQT